MMQPKPRILLVRDAAIGDTIMITPAIRSWSDRGYDVHVAGKKIPTSAVLAFNPHVAEAHQLEAQPHMGARAQKIKELIDKIKPDLHIDLAFSCEGAFLFHSSRREYDLPLSWRRLNARGRSYYKHINVDLAGGDRTMPEMHAGTQEDAWWARFRGLHLGYKIVQVQITGSSINKCYPWWPLVIRDLQRLHPKVMVITTGDPAFGRFIEAGAVEEGADPSRIWATCGDKRYTLRDSLITTKYADLVIGPETGIINASACWDTPKIPLLSHSSADNLTRGWRNCYPIESPARCSPCYRIVSAGDECHMVSDREDRRIAGATKCMAMITPEQVIATAQQALRNGRGLIAA